MRNSGIIRRFDDLGRIVIPKEIRRNLRVKEETPIEIAVDENGNIIQVRCTYDPESFGGKSPDGRKVKVTIHWLSVQHALPAELRMVDKLFTLEDPMSAEDGDFKACVNPHSMDVLNGYVEPAMRDMANGYRCQFERMGYYCIDDDSTPDKLVFNRTVTMRDEWVQIQKQEG